jgi:predicted nucleic acid-binding protein
LASASSAVPGLLLDAQFAGHLQDIETTIQHMIASGARFSPALVDQIIQAAKGNIPPP